MKRRFVATLLSITVLLSTQTTLIAAAPVSANALRAQADQLRVQLDELAAQGKTDTMPELTNEMELLMMLAAAIDRGEEPTSPYRANLQRDLDELRSKREPAQPAPAEHNGENSASDRTNLNDRIKLVEVQIQTHLDNGYAETHPRIKSLRTELNEMKRLQRITNAFKSTDNKVVVPVDEQPLPDDPGFAFNYDDNTAPGNEPQQNPDDLGRRIHFLRLAADNLRQANMDAEAQRMEDEANTLEIQMQELLAAPPLSPEERITELERMVMELRNEVDQLRRDMAMLKGELQSLRVK